MEPAATARRGSGPQGLPKPLETEPPAAPPHAHRSQLRLRRTSLTSAEHRDPLLRRRGGHVGNPDLSGF